MSFTLAFALQVTTLPVFDGPLGLTRIGAEVVGVSSLNFSGPEDLVVYTPGQGVSVAFSSNLTDTIPLPFAAWEGRYVTGSRPGNLIVSDGTSAGTTLFLPPAADVAGETVGDLVAFQGGLAWATQTTVNGQQGPYELRFAAGAGQMPVAIDIGDATFKGRQPTVLGERLLYFNGLGELLATDGTQAGTEFLAPGVRLGVALGAPADLLAEDGERLWFRGEDISTGEYDVYVTDGSAGGTSLFFDMPPGGLPDQLRRFADSLAFRDFISPDQEIYVVDLATGQADILTGVPAKTRLLPVNMLSGIPDSLYLRTPPSVGGPALRRSFGPGSVTIELDPGLALTDVPSSLTQVGFGSQFVFRGDGPQGKEPWFTDGSAGGTRAIADLAPGDSFPSEFTPFGDRVLFEAWNVSLTQRLVYEVTLGPLGVASLEPLGEGCDSAPQLTGGGFPALGGSIQLGLEGGAPLAPAALLVSTQLAPSPALAPCSLGLLAPNVADVVVLDGLGGLLLDVPVPNAPQLQGIAVHLQFAVAEAGGPLLGAFTATRLLEAVIGG